jgi:hypothetical protein
MLSGKVDSLYANFFLSLLENNLHHELLTTEIIDEFRDGNYDFDGPMDQIPQDFYKSQDYFSVFHQLKSIQDTLSHHIRSTWHHVADFPMTSDLNFKSVMPNPIDTLFWDTDETRKKVQIEFKLDEWQLLRRIKDVHGSTWRKSLDE